MITGLARMPRRAASLFKRWRWMTLLTGDPFAAFWLIGRIRLDRESPHRIRYGGHPVLFRARDERALKEVLADRQYSFIEEFRRVPVSPRILDVGAHVGSFALWCLEQAPEAHILCVEANPRTFDILRKNAEQWSSPTTSLRVKHAAASAGDHEMLYMLESPGSSMSDRVDDRGTIPVQNLSLPALVDLCAPRGDEIELAKVDIEGSEEPLICGCPEALQRIRALVVELHPRLCDAGRVEAILRRAFPSVVEIPTQSASNRLLYCRRIEDVSA